MLFTWFRLFLRRLVQLTRAALPMLAWLACLGAPAVMATTVSVTAGAQSNPVILVFGDSLSAEYGLARGSGWVALLEKRLTQERLNYSVANASISGETTSGGAARIEDALKQNRPALVILELGGNDGLRGLSVEATRANLEKMITAAQKAGARVVLAGMQLPPNYGRTYTEKFRLLYGELAKQYKVGLVPFFLEEVAEKRELFQADGIHPTAEAQERLLANVWKALGPMLGKAPKKSGNR